MTPHSQSERTVHLTAAEANQIWAQDYPSESSSGSSKSRISFDKAERSGRSTSRSSKDYGSVDHGEWSDSRSSRDTAQTGRQSQNTRKDANIDEETEVLFPTRQSRPSFRPRKIIVPAEFRNTTEFQDEGYESDTSPGSRRSPHAKSHSHQSSDGGYESSSPSSHSRDTDRSQSSTSPTSGRSLTRSGNKTTASQAITSWDTSSRVSKVESDRHRRRHTKKPYLPSSTTRSHSHNPQHRTMEPSAPSRRETDPSASDLSCYPLSPQKKRLRVGYKVDDPEDWAQNYWKSDLITMENDENRPNFATPQVDTVERHIEANAEKILREGAISRLPSGVTMTDEERSTYVKSRIAFLAESEAAVAMACEIRKRNDKQKYRQQMTGQTAQLIPETGITMEQSIIIAEAEQSFVPTTEITMKDRFPIMYDMGLSGLHSLNDDDSDNASLREEALDEVDTALSRLSDEDANALERELQDFTDSNFTRQSQMGNIGYDMLSHRNTTSFFAPDRKSGHQKKHAVDALAFTLTGSTVICDDVTALRKYLDTGKDIDAPFSRSNKRAFLLSSEDRVEDRDYSSTNYMPIRSLDAETTEAARDAITSNYTTYRNSFAPDHDRTAGGSRTEARSRRLHEFKIRRPLHSLSQSILDQAGDEELDAALEHIESHLAGATYHTEETFAKLYPELSTYKTYGEVLDASEAAKDSGLARKWRRQQCLAGMSNHVLIK